MARKRSDYAADAPLTLGDAAAVLKARRDRRWNAGPAAPRAAREPPPLAGPDASAAAEPEPGRRDPEHDDDAAERP
jgi:hypothetical protein